MSVPSLWNAFGRHGHDRPRPTVYKLRYEMRDPDFGVFGNSVRGYYFQGV